MTQLPILIEKPTKRVISIEEIRDHCRIDPGVTEFDETLYAFVDAATRHVEKSLTIGLITQTWAQSFRDFDCLFLKVRPFREVVSVVYFDSDNASQTLSPSTYAVFPTAAGAELKLAIGQRWPSASFRADAVTVQYRVGVDSPNEVEPAIKTAILLHAATMFETRESHSEKPVRSSGIWDDLIFPFRLTTV